MVYAIMVDMDQTLIEAVDTTSKRYKKSLGKIISYETLTDPDTGETINPYTHTVKVSIRPNATEMVRNIVGNGHTYVLWSAGSFEYVHAIMEYFSSVAGVSPQIIYSRLDMVKFEGAYYKSMISRGFKLSEFLIIEDNPHLVHPNERSRVIQVAPWVFSNTDDTDMNFVSQLFQMYAAVQVCRSPSTITLIA